MGLFKCPYLERRTKRETAKVPQGAAASWGSRTNIPRVVTPVSKVGFCFCPLTLGIKWPFTTDLTTKRLWQECHFLTCTEHATVFKQLPHVGVVSFDLDSKHWGYQQEQTTSIWTLQGTRRQRGGHMRGKCRWEDKVHEAHVPSQSLCRKEMVGPARGIICPNKSGQCGEIAGHGLSEAPEKPSLLSGSREPVRFGLCWTHFADAACDDALNYFCHYRWSQDKGETSSKKSKEVKIKNKKQNAADHIWLPLTIVYKPSKRGFLQVLQIRKE